MKESIIEKSVKKLVEIRTDSSCDKCIEYISSFLKEKVVEALGKLNFHNKKVVSNAY